MLEVEEQLNDICEHWRYVVMRFNSFLAIQDHAWGLILSMKYQVKYQVGEVDKINVFM